MTLSKPTPVPLWDGPESRPETKQQTLTVITKNYSGPLAAIISIGKTKSLVEHSIEQSHLEWGDHEITHSPPNDPERRSITSVYPVESINVVEGIPKELVVWYAYKTRDREMNELFPNIVKGISSTGRRVFLNTLPSVRFLKDDDKQQGDREILWGTYRTVETYYYVELAIQFYPIDKKPRKYELCVNSWDELDLTESG